MIVGGAFVGRLRERGGKEDGVGNRTRMYYVCIKLLKYTLVVLKEGERGLETDQWLRALLALTEDPG